MRGSRRIVRQVGQNTEASKVVQALPCFVENLGSTNAWFNIWEEGVRCVFEFVGVGTRKWRGSRNPGC